MEQPHYTYENHQWIEAGSEVEAVKIYNKLNNCSYYYGHVIGNRNTGQTIFNEKVQHNSFC